MSRKRDLHGVRLFMLIAFCYSWPIFFVVDAWLIPRFDAQNNIAAVWYTALFGHMLGMAGPALAAIILWRVYHHEPLPRWRWSRLKYYAIAVLAMLALWTLPGLLGLAVIDSFHLRSPVESFVWVVIIASFTLGWLAGLGEETGWTAYLLPRLAPHFGNSRALLIAGAIRGLWHWPVLTGPVIAQFVAGERSTWELLAAAVVIALALVISNALFGSLFGWAWYKTQSLPLLAWMHQWFDATRDVTSLLLIGYAGSLWFTKLWSIPFYLVCVFVLKRVAREEKASRWTLAPPRR